MAVADILRPVITARGHLRSEAGLEHATYDRTAQAGTLAFLDVSGPALTEGLDNNSQTPDASPDLLQVCRGIVVVPHAGAYELRLDPNTVGDVLRGEAVVARSGFPDANLGVPVRLKAGPVPSTVKIGKKKSQVPWKGPGQSWQPIGSLDVVRELRPLAQIAGRAVSRTTYEVFRPTAVTRAPAKLGPVIVVTQDGTELTASGPLMISESTVLRARYLAEGTPVGAESTARFLVRPVPELGLVGVWSAERFAKNVLANGVTGGAWDLVLPDGTMVVDDAEQGRVLRFTNSTTVLLSRTGILANEVTIAFHLKGASDAEIMRCGYPHTGVVMNLVEDGAINASGHRVYRPAWTAPGVLSDGTRHQVTATYRGSPFRVIESWCDGVNLASGRSKAPCLTKELELFQSFSGDLVELRLYNRILDAAEIPSLSRGLRTSAAAHESASPTQSIS